MSGQIDDVIKLNGEALSIITSSNFLDFNPINYGITPEEIESDCCRGYWCTYSIMDNQLFLKDLYIHSKDDYYPSIKRTSSLSYDDFFSVIIVFIKTYISN